MNGARSVLRRLEQLGVEVVFGLPGEENLAFVEALEETPIELIVVRHEQHAAFMAATNGRLTGRPGVCLATLGPGAINLFTGLAHAELGGMPVVAITGQKPSRDNDEGAFQVVDVPAAARPLVRWATSVSDPKRLVATIDEAFDRATTGRPGAVLIELPEDIMAEEVDERSHPVPRRFTAAHLDRAALEQATAIIDDAVDPVVLVSGGAADPRTTEAVTRFAERTGLGVVATQLGKGVIPESHPLSLRSLGIHRPDYAHLAIGDADLVLSVGYQPVEHPPLAWNPDQDKTIIHIGPSPAAIERGYQPSHQLIGPPAAMLDQLGEAIAPRPHDEAEAVGRVISDLLDEEDQGRPNPPSPLAVVRTIRAALGADDVVALDNGAYKIWFARHYRCVSGRTPCCWTTRWPPWAQGWPPVWRRLGSTRAARPLRCAATAAS